MAPPQASMTGARARQRTRAKARSTTVRRLGLLLLAVAVILPILVLVFDKGDTPEPVPVPQAERLLPGGPPAPQVVAMQGTLRISLPIAQDKVTAVAYHGADDGALALDPVGTQANAGVFTRLLRRLFGQEQGSIRYYLIGGGSGPDTGTLDVGGPVGTDVYAPVAGTVIGIADQVLAGKTVGVRVEIQPSGNPGLVVSVENIEADPALTVGTAVVASRTKIGSIADLSSIEEAALARYTQDSGQHVSVQVRPTANLSLP